MSAPTPLAAGTNVILGDINLGVSLATALVPEVVVLGKAIASLFQAHPALTSDQFIALATSLADDIHTTNADTLATLAKIGATP